MATTQPRGSRREFWQQLVDEHERSGLPVRSFCQQVKVNEHSFYNWRAQLRRGETRKKTAPVRFALIETPPAAPSPNCWAMELELTTGEQLRIGLGVEPHALRTVIEVLRLPVRP